MTITRSELLRRGVKNLQKFGYPSVSTENITTDPVYRQFFLRMLEDNKGTAGPVADHLIDDLLAEIARVQS